MVSRIEENLMRVREALSTVIIRSCRKEEDVLLVAVSKTHPVEDILEAVRCGVSAVGENRAQELVEKKNLWRGPRIEWRFIGHLQSNKVRKVVECASSVDSVDSLPLARQLSRVAEEKGIRLPVLLEVNTSGEASKHGVSSENATPLLEGVLKECPFLSVEGLMTIGPLTDDESQVRRAFASLRLLKESLSERFGYPMQHLSMGMSGDFAWAVEEGSTMVRIGSAIFGVRS